MPMRSGGHGAPQGPAGSQQPPSVRRGEPDAPSAPRCAAAPGARGGVCVHPAQRLCPVHPHHPMGGARRQSQHHLRQDRLLGHRHLPHEAFLRGQGPQVGGGQGRPRVRLITRPQVPSLHPKPGFQLGDALMIKLQLTRPFQMTGLRGRALTPSQSGEVRRSGLLGSLSPLTPQASA